MSSGVCLWAAGNTLTARLPHRRRRFEHNYPCNRLLHPTNYTAVLFVYYSLFVFLVTVSFHKWGPSLGSANEFFKRQKSQRMRSLASGPPRGRCHRRDGRGLGAGNWISHLPPSSRGRPRPARTTACVRTSCYLVCRLAWALRLVVAGCSGAFVASRGERPAESLGRQARALGRESRL